MGADTRTVEHTTDQQEPTMIDEIHAQPAMSGRASLWVDEITGASINADQLCQLRRKAHLVYLRNSHIFEDEADALAALGAVPLLSARRRCLRQDWLGGIVA
jgi:hypothetical protein